MSVLAVPLRALDPCFEGGVPATLCTASAAGVPNASFLSVVHRVDDEHIALSFQYFRKTKQNLSENPRSRLLVIEPSTAVEFRLSLELVRTETDGPTFERLATALAAVASQTGMSDSFVLRGADIHRVTECERVANGVGARLPASSFDSLAGLAKCTAVLAGCADLEELLQRALEELESSLGYSHAFVMAVDEEAQTLFSVATRGYSPSGVGAELKIGEGVIGIAAERRSTLRVANMSRERILAAAVQTDEEGECGRLIPLPGLRRTESQLVSPLLSEGRLLGVLCLQSPEAAAFGRADEDVVSVVANQLASGMARFGGAGAQEDDVVSSAAEIEPPLEELKIRYYAEDDSVFVDNEYLIKGVAGRILWLLLRAHEKEGRRSFSNRELRLDPRLGLPALRDNLETRLITLRKRLEERCPQLRIRRTGRGRFDLDVSRKLSLEAV